MQRRRDIENLSFRPFQFLESRTADVERALCVDIDDCAKAVRRKLVRRTKEIARGAVYDDVNMPEMLGRLGDRIFDGAVIANVRGDGQTLTAILLYELLLRYQVLWVAADDREFRTVLGKRSRNAAGEYLSRRLLQTQLCLVRYLY